MSESAGRPVFEGPVDHLLKDRIVEHSQSTAGRAASDNAPGAGGKERADSQRGDCAGGGFDWRMLAAVAAFLLLLSGGVVAAMRSMRRG